MNERFTELFQSIEMPHRLEVVLQPSSVDTICISQSFFGTVLLDKIDTGHSLLELLSV